MVNQLLVRSAGEEKRQNGVFSASIKVDKKGLPVEKETK